MYLASAISPKGELIYVIRNRPFDAEAIIEFLKLLLQIMPGKLIIIWDNASIHNCKATRAFLNQLQGTPQQDRLWLVQQPKYSPELNADEQVWNYLKYFKLKNTFYFNVKELKNKVIKAMDELKDECHIIQNFFHHPKLAFYN